MSITLNGTTGITTPDVTSSGSLNIDASAPDDSLMVDASGNVGIGTSSPAVKLHASGSSTYVAGIEGSSTGAFLGFRASGSGGSMADPTVAVGANADELLFRAGGAERARIDSSGNFLVGKTSSASAVTVQGINFRDSGQIVANTGASGSTPLYVCRDANGDAITFFRDGAVRGEVVVNTSSVSYNTTSDYRLKENVTSFGNASSRVLQLNPVRFNFIGDSDTVDGFLAHEAQAVVPEAVTGEKDAVNEDGSPNYQGIDQSKLVPLLTAALQEALAKIDDLTARVSALEAV